MSPNPNKKPRWSADKKAKAQAAREKRSPMARRLRDEREHPSFERGTEREFTGGADRGDRRDRPQRGGYQGRDDRGDRGSYQRHDRGGYQRRDDRGGYQRRDDRGDRGGYQRRDDRGGYPRRDDRGAYQRRDDRDFGGRREIVRNERGDIVMSGSDAPQSPTFGGRGDRQDRPRRDFGDRPQRGGFDRRDDRGDRGGYPRRDDRGDRDGGFRRDDRGSRDFGGRPERGGYQGRDDRGGYQRRDDRDVGGRGERQDRPRRDFGDRPQRGGFERRDDRGGFERRDDRGGYQRRDDRDFGGRGERQDRPRRDFGDRPQRGGFERRDDRGGYQRRDDRGFERRERVEPREGIDVHTDDGAGFERESRPGEGRLRTSAPVAPTAVEVTDDNGFLEIGLPRVVVERLARDGIGEPFPIQKATIPDILAGKDVLGRGRTGSGKTLSFGLPTLTRLAGELDESGQRVDPVTAQPNKPRALILTPTRELAMQVSDALQPFVHTLGLKHKLVAGGMPYPPQLMALEKGLDLLIATPGRLNDLIERGAADMSAVEVVILDEADHMAEMGFMPEVSAILDLMPEGGQRLLFSATLDHGIDTLVERYLTDPVTHSTDDAQAAHTTMEHHLLLIEPKHKKPITADLANRAGRTVVFVRTKLGADRVALQLRESGVWAAALHGGLTQTGRNRVLAAFKEGTLPVLVATDVAARGIHVDDVSLVIQVDPPADHKDYLHRAGRTARAGETGQVVTLALPHQKRTMERLLGEAGVETEARKVFVGEEFLSDTLGARRVSNEPIDEGEFRRLMEPPRRPGRGGGRFGGHGGGRGGHGGRGGYGRRDGDRDDRGGRGGRGRWSDDGGRGGHDGGGYRGGRDSGGYRGGRDSGYRGGADR